MSSLALTGEAVLRCTHGGTVELRPSQSWVRINGVVVLVEPDPEGRDIDGCPNVNVNIKKCGTTLRVKQGYSAVVRINGRPVCLESIEGLTDGTPQGGVDYVVRQPGQSFVRVTS